ncbi:MAG: benzoate/H(+) symporter BenE family transporter, partial [Gammaproteobacteria bacterium]|nr:benzoate/H(+) symporter BenE family transporter [Gammaproteobacteria bacterium]
MLRWFNPAYISAGLVAVLVGYTSSAAIIFQALQTLGAPRAMADSWFLVLGLGMGITCIGLSIYYRQPILTAWSTPGAAIMVTGLADMSIGAAVGAFLFSSALLVIVGISGLFTRLVSIIPPPIAAALLAGVLMPFALQALASLNTDLVLGLSMLISFFISHLWWPRYSVLITLTIGLLVAVQQSPHLFQAIHLHTASPLWVTPEFNLAAIISLGVPLFIVTMASQNLPGIAALRTANYQAPASPLVGWTGFTGLLTAPFGGFAYNLAAITATIC